MYKLVISDDDGHTTVVPLLRDEITIGRTDGNSIRLTERNVSRSHARLLKRNEAYIVEDLGSYNGVIVNGERIEDETRLCSGDQLCIGDYDLTYQSDVVAIASTIPAPKPRSEPPPRLVVLSEPAAGAEFSLNKPALRIGRDEKLDIWINHKSISHEHAEVQVKNGKVTLFDLDSANGIKINGVKASRAVLDSGDVVELGKVRFRYLPSQGAHSLEELPVETIASRSVAPSRKSLVAVSVVAVLLAFGAGALFATMRSGPEEVAVAVPPVVPTAAEPRSSGSRVRRQASSDESGAPAPAASAQPAATDPAPSGEAADDLVEEPQEWEERLSKARKALARGRVDRAYAIANDLPDDSVLRETPEFGEIRYRYAQAHITEAELALQKGELERVQGEVKLVLGLPGITSKQRQDARRLMRSARGSGASPKPAAVKASAAEEAAAPKVDPQLALDEAYACVSRGDNACVVRALRGGKAKSPAALALLIETYRAMDNLPAARKQMQTFVKRYPDNPRTPKYQQILAGQ
jgi:pSer/pThr/pTyr-binding forkhead associated (FHA) protein